MESWHSSLRRLLPTHPNIFVFIYAIKKQHTITKIHIQNAQQGATPPRRRKKYILLEDRLKKAFSDHVAGVLTTDMLLSRVKYCIKISKPN